MDKFHDVGRWEVEPQDERPARPDGTCFYCHSPIGGRHKEMCVIPSRKVVVRFSIDIEMTEPLAEGYDDDWVKRHYTNSSWCQSNLMDLLKQIEEDNHGCLCGKVQVEVIASD